METRWNAYAKVAANFAVNRVLIRMRLKTWLKEQDVFASGGGELAAAARLVYWAACDVSTCIDMHLLAEASRAVITPAIFWLQEKDGRRMLEFPEYLRIVLARLTTLASDGLDAFPENVAFARSVGVSVEDVQDRIRLAAEIISAYIINRSVYFRRPAEPCIYERRAATPSPARAPLALRSEERLISVVDATPHRPTPRRATC